MLALLTLVLAGVPALAGCDLGVPAVDQPATTPTPGADVSPGVVFPAPSPVRPPATPPEGNPAPG